MAVTKHPDVTTEMLDPTFVQELPDWEKIITCYQCGTCSSSCPSAYAMDYAPRQLWRLLEMGLRDEVLKSETFWLCTQCYACTVRCPRGIKVSETMRALRNLAYQSEEVTIPANIVTMRETVTTRYNISGDDNATRLIWSENMAQVPERLQPRQGAEVIYFAGCVASFYPQTYSIPQATVQILEHLDVDYTTLAGEEWCCGYPLHGSGFDDEVVALARHNVETTRKLGSQILVTSCPSCYYTWRHLYPQLLGEPLGLEVLHISEYLQRHVEDGTLRLGQLERVVTYHDPCDLGRKSGFYDPPRFILQSIPGLELREMANTRESALCCGGGGDVEIAQVGVIEDISHARVLQAQATGAGAIVSACQQCKRTLASALRAARIRMRTYDLTEVVLLSIQSALEGGA